MIGRTYLLKGQPVVVLARWRESAPAWGSAAPLVLVEWSKPPRPRASGPRNVRIQHADGSLDVRPFRGLRRPPRPGPGPE